MTASPYNPNWLLLVSYVRLNVGVGDDDVSDVLGYSIQKDAGE